MNKKRVNKSYSKEFKEEAVVLITERGYSVAVAQVVSAVEGFGLTNCIAGNKSRKH